MQQKSPSVFNLAVIVAALGYFVDIYDLLLFNIVRKSSIEALGVTETTAILAASTKIINWQMIGLLIGGVIWGMMGDKRGRLSVLFGSILLYSTANFITSYVGSIEQYAWARFVTGIGLAGELGAGITLVSELLPKAKRGIGTSLVAGIGLFGAVFAYFTFQYSQDWRLCYKIGAALGVVLLILRVSVAESGMFKQVKAQKNVQRGNILLFFTNATRFRKYIMAILIGLPTWFVIGVMVNYSNDFAKELYGVNKIDSGRATMFAYIGIALGDITIGFVSQYFKSRKKALYLFYGLSILSAIYYFSPLNNSDTSMYLVCGLLGFSTGFWAIFVTIGAEQFGTNLRATAATTIPNMVRGSVPLINLLFKTYLIGSMGAGFIKSGIITGVVVIVIALMAAYFTEETFHKDLNYVEGEGI